MTRSSGDTGKCVEPIIEASPPTEDGATLGPPAPPTEPPPPSEPTRSGLTLPRWLIATVAIVLVGAVGYGLGALTKEDNSSSNTASPATPQTPARPNPTPTAPSTPSTPGAAALSGIGMVQADMPSGFGVVLIPAGNQVSGTTTLDLCNGTFPSESLRTARLQLVAADAQGNVALSTEAVLYQNAAATKQAFDELASVAAKCPSTPVRSPSGGTTVTTMFDPPPDGAWPQIATVDRLAYSFTATDPLGQASPSIAVYLKRGRVLLGIYFADPTGTIPTISGQRTIPGIVTAFANRIAQLPDSVVNG
jgi:hypothetical protein